MVLNLFPASQLLVLSMLLILLTGIRFHTGIRRASAGLLMVVAIGSVTNVLVAGVVHDDRDNRLASYHLHDLFHYLMSAKYFSELGYQQIYQCTVVAARELQAEGIEVPQISRVRDLENRFQTIAGDNIVCGAYFSASRWGSFKSDLSSFFKLSADTLTWQSIVTDNGNNPPPSWALPASVIVWWLPLDTLTIQLLASLDLLLIFLLLPLLLLWLSRKTVPAREVVSASALLLSLLGTVWFLAPSWVFGSYFREVWLFALLMAVVAWCRGAIFWAGFSLGLAAWLRVFPVVFLVPAVFLLTSSRDRWWFFGGIATISLAQLGSLMIFGLAVWIAFFENLFTHGDLPALNHVGYYQMITQTFVVTRFAEAIPDAINFELDELMYRWYEYDFFFHVGLKLLVVSMLLFVCLAGRARLSRIEQATMMLFSGLCLIFFFLNIAHYYYVMIAAYAWLVFLQESEQARTLAIVNSIFLVALLVADLVPRQQIVLFSIQNTLVFAWLSLSLVLLVWRRITEMRTEYTRER